MPGGGVCHTPHPVDRQMPVKILPCPKLCLRAVIISMPYKAVVIRC